MTQIPRLPGSLLRQPPIPVRLREDELDLLAIFRLMRRRLWLMMAIGIGVIAAALPLILVIEREYYGATQILIQKPAAASLVAADEIDPLDLNTEVARLSSRDIAARVIDKFALSEREEFNPELREESIVSRLTGGLRQLLFGGDAAERPAVDDPLDLVIPEFLRALTIRRNGTSSVIEIGFRSEDPTLAGDVPNALVQIYLDDRGEKLRGQVNTARDWIDERITEQQARVSAAYLAVKRFREANGLVSDDAQADAVRTISSLSARQAAITTKRAELAAALSALQEAKDKPGQSEAVDSETMAELRRDLLLQQEELKALLETLGESHPEVVSKRARIRQIEAAMGAETAEYALSLQTRMTALDREELAVLNGLDATRNALSRLSLVSSELTGLIRTAEAAQKALDELERQGLELGKKADFPVAQVEVLSPATVPQAPTGRGRLTYLIGAIAVAGLIALTIACIREMFDRGLRSHQQLDGIAGVVPAGMIPRVSRTKAGNLPELLWEEPGGMFSDAMRGLALALERGEAGKLPNSLVVTSALPREGKSVTSTALAMTLAAEGRRVLLVDADLRHGRVHELFGRMPMPGLAELLAGARDIKDVVRRDEPSGVDYITRGESAAAVCDRQMASYLLEYARCQDQMVIFDCPPVLATADALVFSGLVDRSILVMRWGKTPRRFVELAADRLLESNGNKHILTVLTMVDPRRHALYGFKDAGLFTGELKRYFT